jgi:hypothetical protein
MTNHKYYTLLSKGLEAYHNGEWVIEFGDYDKETVTGEAEKMRECADSAEEKIIYKVITTADDQASINAAVAKLNNR